MAFTIFSSPVTVKSPNQCNNASWEEAISLERQATQAFENSDFKQALGFCKKAVLKKETATGEFCLTTAKTYTQLGDILEKMENNLEAGVAYIKALQITTFILPPSTDLRILELFKKVGFCYEKQELLEKAVKIYSEAFHFYQSVNKKTAFFFCKKIGDIYLMTGGYSLALKWLTAIDLSIETDPEIREKILSNIVCCSKKLRSEDNSLEAPSSKRICLE